MLIEFGNTNNSIYWSSKYQVFTVTRKRLYLEESKCFSPRPRNKETFSFWKIQFFYRKLKTIFTFKSFKILKITTKK